jgi:hypothetical protein
LSWSFRVMPVVIPTPSKEVELYFCGSGILPRSYRGWKPLPLGLNFFADRVASRAIIR